MELWIILLIIGSLILPAILHKLIYRMAQQRYLKYRAKCNSYKISNTVGSILYQLSVEFNYGLFFESVKGVLSDCYVANTNTIYLSDRTSRSPITLSIALHEFGHAKSTKEHPYFETIAEFGRKTILTRFLVCVFLICFILQYCIVDDYWHTLFFTLMILCISVFVILKVLVLITELIATHTANNLIVNYVYSTEVLKYTRKTLQLNFVTYIADIFSDFGLSVLFFLAQI